MGENKNQEFRIEHDTMGEVKVPISALYRAQTQRAVENFPISGTKLESAQISALAHIKKAAAIVNADLGVLPSDIATAISWAADQVSTGKYDSDFPIDIYQTGSGTSSNMNANEVLASLASKKLGSPVHPNDHVNASQSSNDVFPTSVHLAATKAVIENAIPALKHLSNSLQKKVLEFNDIVKSGRTHLMDATPITLGQEFSGYKAAVDLGIERLKAALIHVAQLPLGGTAVGTGINTPKGFPQKVIKVLAKQSGLPVTEAENHFEAQGARDGLVELSGVLKVIAVSYIKICNDLRWMGSGPNCGLGEISLPDLQPGSSIMPGKVNPVIPEATLMVCSRIIGNDSCITTAGASGAFELNVQIPIMGTAILESLRLLSNVSILLADKVIDGLVANTQKCLELAESSPSIVTPLNKIIGYENASKIAKYSVKNKITVKEATVKLGFVERKEITQDQLDKALNVYSMTSPN